MFLETTQSPGKRICFAAKVSAAWLVPGFTAKDEESADRGPFLGNDAKSDLEPPGSPAYYDGEYA